MNFRPDIDTYFMNMVQVAATRGSCLRRQTGCILVNERNHILATGYNGKSSGLSHCFQNPCSGADAESGTRLNECQAIHAEANALLQCKDVYKVHTAYCTTSPCSDCVKLLMNTSCVRIVFLEPYPHDLSGKRWTESYYRPSHAVSKARDWDQYVPDDEHFVNIKERSELSLKYLQ